MQTLIESYTKAAAGYVCPECGWSGDPYGYLIDTGDPDNYNLACACVPCNEGEYNKRASEIVMLLRAAEGEDWT